MALLSALNTTKREKLILNGDEIWLDRSGYPSIWLYPSDVRI